MFFKGVSIAEAAYCGAGVPGVGVVIERIANFPSIQVQKKPDFFVDESVWGCLGGNLSIQIHPVLILIGLIIIGGEAIISYKALPLKKQVKKLIHLVLHSIALILGIVGVYAAFKYHNESGIANLYSLHSWLGIGIIVLYGVQWIYGFIVFFYPGGTASVRRESLPWHVLFGLFVYILAIGNAALGFLEKLTFLESSGLAKYGSEAFLVNFTAIVTILFGAFVVLTSLSQPPNEDKYSYFAL
ncbi:transmembrane ascorbate ferrireductase 1-like [Camellia sinensis]|uniref:transmembrane ascorbate ferrireductase 1-like n=1 Tax=Camellia sinensis TaxID=4442 RepID=UPI00103628EC|nr:transmembrane ascorbate ferrireductase 1-like [Camellia sinensis]